MPTVHTTHSFTPLTKGILRRLILAPVSACLAQLDAPSACCRCLMPLHICHRACLHKDSASRLSNAWTNPEGTDEQQRAVVVQILHRPRVQTLCFRGLISCVPFAVPHDRIDRKALITRSAPEISQLMTQMPAASRCPRAEAEMEGGRSAKIQKWHRGMCCCRSCSTSRQQVVHVGWPSFVEDIPYHLLGAVLLTPRTCGARGRCPGLHDAHWSARVCARGHVGARVSSHML